MYDIVIFVLFLSFVLGLLAFRCSKGLGCLFILFVDSVFIKYFLIDVKIIGRIGFIRLFC